jgi:hypothetical protein
MNEPASQRNAQSPKVFRVTLNEDLLGFLVETVKRIFSLAATNNVAMLGSI